MLASYACNPNNSRGRLYKETSELEFISSFELDRTRIIESTAFRRLEHKTQVFISSKGDHYRNRLTHSIEAAQIARIICKALNLSSDLAENLTLAHDIGHTPFGHAGEAALSEMLGSYNLSFDHNSHAIKLLTEIEQKHPFFKGLNLTWEFLSGIAKHNGPILNPSQTNSDYSKKHDLELEKYPSLEAQVSSISDDIAYNNHDIDDGFRAGIITINDLKSINLLKKTIEQVSREFPNAEDYKIIHESVQRIKNQMIIDAINTTKHNLKSYSIHTCDDVYNSNRPIVQFSDSMERYHQEIKSFLKSNFYYHSSVIEMTNKAKNIIRFLFSFYMENTRSLPASWQENLTNTSEKEKAIIISDYIACMSDRYATSYIPNNLGTSFDY
ncbi:MAG: deoxyguanosinetriphosphate triphosphohydrolase [Pseudomonadota bacterium]